MHNMGAKKEQFHIHFLIIKTAITQLNTMMFAEKIKIKKLY